MAKRRFQRSDADRSPEELSPEERRIQRKKERQKGTAKGLGTGWRRAAYVGVPSAVIVTIIVVILYSNQWFAPPCLVLQSIPSSSGDPAFPSHNTTDFSTTWCPNDPAVLAVEPFLTIHIEQTSVTLPASIGRNSSFTGNYACDLPLLTEPISETGQPAGTILVISPWPYVYTLGQFFGVWYQSYSTVAINSTNPSAQVTYTSSDLLGFTADSTHAITLFVDNQISNAGPSLGLDTLDHGGSPVPSCLSERYGGGHTIALAYTYEAPTAVSPHSPPPTLETGPADPALVASLFFTPGPHASFGMAAQATAHDLAKVGNPFLVMRVG